MSKSDEGASSGDPQAQDYLIGAGEEAESHKANLLVHDLINLNCKLWLLAERDPPATKDDHTALAKHLVDIIQNGSAYTLPNSAVVAESFFKGGGRFLKKDEEGDEVAWTAISDDAAVELLVKLIQEEQELLEKAGYGKEHPAQATENGEADSTQQNDKEGASADQEEPTSPNRRDKRLKTSAGEVAKPASKPTDQVEETIVTAKPRFDDIVLLERMDAAEKTYVDHQGNAFLILELSQFFTEQYMLNNVSAAGARADAALATTYALLGPIKEAENEGALLRTRFLVRPKGYVFTRTKKETNETWQVLKYTEAAEFVLSLLFDKLVDKESIAAALEKPMPTSASADGDKNSEDTPTSTVPVKNPASHDVLLGRGGLTNNHPGNRRFRDIILLHRPDYVRAIKIEKPNVARRIVRAIRCGSPPGRFLKKDPKNGMWYDVGDRHAAEKTSQALREKTQAEKAARFDDDKHKRLRDGGLAHLTNQRPTRMHPILPILAPTDLHRMVQPHFVPHASLGSVPVLGPYGMAVRAPNGASKNGKGAAKSSGEADGKNGKEKEGSEDSGDDYNDKPRQELLDADGNITITDSDILCGRGGLTNNHLGNKRFRDIVSLHRPDYVRAAKIHKPAVARLIVRAIRNSDPPGRFLRKDEETGKWYDIGDKRAAEKASQALREKSPEERDLLKHDVVNGVPLSYFSNPALFNATAAMIGAIPGMAAVPGTVADAAATVTPPVGVEASQKEGAEGTPAKDSEAEEKGKK